MRARVLPAAATAALLFIMTVSTGTATLTEAESLGPGPSAVEGVAPERLQDTGIYTLGRPFSPQYPLWTDGATKSRWVYLPPGASIDGSHETEWAFPVGTRFWKDFSFNGRKAETRMLWRASADRWVAVSYIWNEDGSDAVLASAEGTTTNIEVAPGRRHAIPSRDECLMCHGTRQTGPLGFTALQLSTDRDPNAIHGEPIAPGMATLKTLVDERLITGTRTDILESPPRIRTSDPTTRTVLGYLAANCGTCHNGRGEIAALAPILKVPELLHDGDAVGRSLVGQSTKWQVPGLPEGASVLLNPDVPEQSAMLVRMHSRRPSSQMPPLGTVIRDERALDAIRNWIETHIVRWR